MAKYKCLISGYSQWNINEVYDENSIGEKFTVKEMNEAGPERGN